MTGAGEGDDPLLPYVPALLSRWGDRGGRHRRLSGSLAFVDISGFTRLTERLAARGKVGAEQMSDMLSATFTSLLTETRDDGGDLVKWGGDAMLLLFDGPDHARRAAHAAHRMRATLADIGRIVLPSGTIRLRMSVGIHSGDFDFFLVGDPAVHQELMISGPAASTTAAMEAATPAGHIGLSTATAALLEPRSLGVTLPGGRLLRSSPGPAAAVPTPVPVTVATTHATVDPAALLSPPVRRHLLGGAADPEHRLITVGFVAFSGTDGLLGARGPEALADALDAVVRNVQHACADHDVTFFESDIDLDGGKIMLTSGAPLSAHHDEERMLRAARLVLDRAGALPLRIGVNRGHVFAGDFGPSFRRTYSVKGDAINLAARVMAKARPGQLLVTPSVVEHSQTVFRTGELPPFSVKGKSQPVRAVEVGELIGSREADRPSAPVVGRDGEMDVLVGSLSDACSGAGRLVEIAGEAGMGKSRLVAELLSRSPGVTVVTGPSDPYGSATAYLPFRRLLHEVLGVPLRAGPEEAVDLLARRVAGVAAHLVPWLPLLATPLGALLPQTAETRDLDGRFRRARLEAVMGELLEALLPGPTVLVFEDTHLMDDPSCDLLRHLATDLGRRPWLVLVTRQEQQAGFVPTTGDGVTSLRLAPLDAATALMLARQHSDDRALTGSALTALATRSGGNPLFLEELVLEASRAGSAAGLPESVEGLVTSQIDRLDPADRTVLRYAAVLGTRVDEVALDGLLERHGVRVPAGAMSRLADFLVRDDEGRLRFRNTLLRDVAYEGLPYSRRERLHEHVGLAIEEASPDPEKHAELLSLHFFHAGRHERAWRYSRVAANRALAGFAHVPAIELLERAADSAVPSLGLDPSEVAQVLEDLADSRFLVGASEEAARAYILARRQVRGDPVRLAGITEKEARIDVRRRAYSQAMRRISRGLAALDGASGPRAEVARSLLARRYAFCRFSQGRIDEALRWAHQARETAAHAQDVDALAQAHEMLNAIHAGSGREEPEGYGALALAAYTATGNLPRQGHCLNNLAVQAFTAGRWDEALASYGRAGEIFRRIGDTAAEGNATFNRAELLVCQRRHAEAALLLPDVLRTARAVHDEELVALALREQARTMAAAGEVHRGLEALQVTRGIFEQLGEHAEVRVTDAVVAELLLDAGRTAQAGSVLRSLATSDLTATEHRLIGRHHLVEQRPADALLSLQRGLAAAREDTNRFEEGLLLLDLAAVRRYRGESDASELREGREILAGMGVLVPPVRR